MKVLVTGAAGFIGGNLLHKLKSESIECVGIDSFTGYYSISMKKQRIQQLEFQNSLVNGDLNNQDVIKKIFTEFRPSHVVHLAGQGGVRASKFDPIPYLETNQIGFTNVLMACEEYSVSKFIYASSSSVYAESSNQPFRETDQLIAPKSLYALSKISNELVSKHYPIDETKRIGLRFFTVYGPWGRPDMAIFRFLASGLLKKEFQLTAKTSVKRDFTFVEDVSRSILDILLSTEVNMTPEILNIAGGQPYTLAAFFKLANSLGINPNIVLKEPDSLDVAATHASIDKLQSYGFHVPSTSLSSGLSETWEWMKSQKLEHINEWFDYFVKKSS